MTDAIGAHFFHRWRGWWGTPAAFNQAYIGSEPLPVPHAAPVRQPAAPMIADAARTTVAGATAPAAPKAVPMSLAMIQPAYADSGALRGTLTATGKQPYTRPQSKDLDRWKYSVNPLQSDRSAGQPRLAHEITRSDERRLG